MMKMNTNGSDRPETKSCSARDTYASKTGLGIANPPRDGKEKVLCNSDHCHWMVRQLTLFKLSCWNLKTRRTTFLLRAVNSSTQELVQSAPLPSHRERHASCSSCFPQQQQHQSHQHSLSVNAKQTIDFVPATIPFNSFSNSFFNSFFPIPSSSLPWPNFWSCSMRGTTSRRNIVS